MTLAEMIASCDANRVLNVEQAKNGYIVTGQTTYINRDTKGVEGNMSERGVYSDATTAAAAVSSFLSTGTLG